MIDPDTPHQLRRRAPTIVVVGDLMLDGWWIGRSDRVAREAPAPVVEISERLAAPGGAANTARNLAALGVAVRMVGVVGDDPAGARVVDLLAGDGVDVSGVVRHPGVRTVTKDRVVSADQILLRIDEVRQPEPRPDLTDVLRERLEHALEGADALLVGDYGGHDLEPPVRAALTRTGRPPWLVVDAHDPAAWAELAPDLATPNAAEAWRLLGIQLPQAERRAEVVAAAADRLRERTGARAVLVTLDRDGTLLIGGTKEAGRADGVTHRTYARPSSEAKAAGAGDTFVATLTAGVVAGLELPDATDLAQAAADVVVQRFGTSVCRTEDLVAQLAGHRPAVLDADELAQRVAHHRAAGRRVVFTNGCFDVLHRGHTTYLEQAAGLGDLLIVAVNSDSSVRRLKGPTRPINPAEDRAGVIAALSCVDYVTVFDTDTPIPLLERLRPEVYAKGGDYSPEMLAETPIVEAYGGEVRLVGYVPSQSTTDVVDRIRSTLQ